MYVTINPPSRQGAFEVAARDDHAELVTLLMEMKTENLGTQQMVADLGDKFVTLLQLYQEVRSLSVYINLTDFVLF